MNYRILEQCYYTQRSVSNIHVTSIPQQCLLLCLSQLLLFMQWHSPRGYVYDESHGWTNSKEMHRRKKTFILLWIWYLLLLLIQSTQFTRTQEKNERNATSLCIFLSDHVKQDKENGGERERRVSVTLCNQSITNRVPSSIRSFLIILYYDEAEYPETWMFVPFEM